MFWIPAKICGYGLAQSTDLSAFISKLIYMTAPNHRHWNINVSHAAIAYMQCCDQ